MGGGTGEKAKAKLELELERIIHPSPRLFFLIYERLKKREKF